MRQSDLIAPIDVDTSDLLVAGTGGGCPVTYGPTRLCTVAIRGPCGSGSKSSCRGGGIGHFSASARSGVLRDCSAFQMASKGAAARNLQRALHTEHPIRTQAQLNVSPHAAVDDWLGGSMSGATRLGWSYPNCGLERPGLTSETSSVAASHGGKRMAAPLLSRLNQNAMRGRAPNSIESLGATKISRSH